MANTIENIIGVESGSTVEFEALVGTVAVSSSTVRTGTYSFRVNPATTSTGSGRVSGITAAGIYGSIATATAYSGFWFRYATKPAANDEEFFRWFSATTTLKCAGRITSTGTIKLYNISGTNTATGTTALAQDTWYRIFTKASNSTSGTFEVKIYDSTGALLETITDAACDMGATNVTRLALGKHVNQNGNSVDFFYDDIWLDSQDYPTTDLWQVSYMALNGDSLNEFTGGTGASDYTQINERPLSSVEYIADPSDASPPVLYRGTLASFATSGINASATIAAAKVFGYAFDPVASVNTFNIGFRSNATDSYTSNQNTPNSLTEYGKINTTDPNTAATWTKAGLEAALFTVRENTASEDIRVYWGGVFVLNTPPAVTFVPQVTMFM